MSETPNNDISLLDRWIKSDTNSDKYEITAEFPKDSNLEEILNPSEICLLQEKNDISQECKDELKMLEATLILVQLQQKINAELITDDIDLIYDPKNKTFQYKLFDNEQLVIPVNLNLSHVHEEDIADNYTNESNPDMSKLRIFGEFLVEMINNIDDLYFEEETWNIVFSELNWFQSIQGPWFIFDKSYLNTEILKDIFYYNPNEDLPEKQANQDLNSVLNILKEAKKYRNTIKINNPKTEEISK